MEKNELYEERGQVGGAVGATIQLIIGVGIAVMMMVFLGVLAGQTFQLTESQTTLTAFVLREGFTPINSTAVALANDEIIPGSLSIYNGTDRRLLDLAGNFTVDFGNGTVTLIDITYNDTVLGLFANYTHGPQAIENSIKRAIQGGFTAFEQTGDYLPLIVLAIVIFLILVLVMGFTTLGNFAGGGRGGSVL